MGRDKRGKQDGTGPHRDSAQRSTHKTGRRQQQGIPCPVKRKK